MAAGGERTAFLAFVVAALTMTLALTVSALAISLARVRLVAGLKRGPRAVQRWGGVVLVLAGAWLLALAIWPEAFGWLFLTPAGASQSLERLLLSIDQ